MNEWNSTFESEHMENIPFNDTAQFSIVADGFDGINSIRAFIPKEMRVRILTIHMRFYQ